jgi:hypothetical protein
MGAPSGSKPVAVVREQRFKQRRERLCDRLLEKAI